MKPVSLLAALIFALAALCHVLRLVFGIEVVVGGVVAPMWPSVVGVLIPGALAVGIWREARSPALPERSA